MTAAERQQRIRATADGLVSDYAAANPTMRPREIREMCEREAIQNEGCKAK